ESLYSPAFGDVRIVEEKNVFAFKRYGEGINLDRNVAPVLSAVKRLEKNTGGIGLFHLLFHQFPGIGCPKRKNSHAEQFIMRVPVNPGRQGIGFDNPPVRLPDKENDILCLFRKYPEDPQPLFCAFFCSDIGNRQPDHWCFPATAGDQDTFQTDRKYRAVAPCERKGADLFFSLFQHINEIPVPVIDILFCDKFTEPCFYQFVPLYSEKRSTCQVRLGYQCLVGKRKIAKRGKLKEVQVLVTRLFGCKMCCPESLVLHLELDLVYLEFMDEFFCRLAFQAGRTPPGACETPLCIIP